MIFTLSLIGLLILTILCLFKYRQDLYNFLPHSIKISLKKYTPINTFENAIESGFSSSSFDLRGNLNGDNRIGLDENMLTNIRRIMDLNNVGFDEARSIITKKMFQRNGIDEFGFPLDPKAITSLA